ncbi:MAG: TonB-dependent receptor plug domain-containing protein [Bacteroidales bacterium]|nr:TonB-dependent receptor plug domain-containing protein [Bacteroidales bacterium]
MFGFLELSFTQQSGSITGKLFDKSNNEPLFFANIYIEGTSIGSVTDDKGNFYIGNLKPGTYTVVFNYVGYNDEKRTIDVQEGSNSVIEDVYLEFTSLMSEEVIITGMSRGQAAAINHQKNSNKIVNVVSKEKIEELPDVNAAEAVGRLPGVSVVREGGEGSKVTLMGMAPKFNTITISGEKIPSTDGEDRSVDLSMISTEAVSGIEVFKAITPDMDGDAIGGTINVISQKASPELKGNIKIQTGYNFLRNEPGNYKAAFDAQKRFWENRLGIIIGANTEKVNRSSYKTDGDWYQNGVFPNGTPKLQVESFDVIDINKTKSRSGGSLNLDLDLKNHDIVFVTYYGNTLTDESRIRRRYRMADSYQEYDLLSNEKTQSFISSSLSGEHKIFNSVQLNWKTAYSFSLFDEPGSNSIRFREQGAFNGTSEELTYIDVVNDAKNDLSNTFFEDGRINHSAVDNNYINVSLDLKIPLN